MTAPGRFEAEVWPLYGRLRGFIFLRVQDGDAAEDLAQETMIAAVSALERFRGDCTVWGWLCAIAMNKIRDYFRAYWHNQDRIARVAGTAEGGAPTLRPLEGDIDRDTERLRAALARIPEHYRAALWRKYTGWSMDEMAVAEGTTRKTIESRLSRARVALRAAWADPDSSSPTLDQRRAQVWSLYLQGRPYRRIAVEVGVSSSVVSHDIRAIKAQRSKSK